MVWLDWLETASKQPINQQYSCSAEEMFDEFKACFGHTNDAYYTNDLTLSIYNKKQPFKQNVQGPFTTVNALNRVRVCITMSNTKNLKLKVQC